VGIVLSTRRVPSVSVEVLPARSVTKTRRYQRPSAAAVVSKSVEYGELLSVPIVVQATPSLERWKATDVTPLVASLAVAPRPTVLWRYAPGSARAAVGAVTSTVTSTTSVAELAEPSVAIARIARVPSPGSVQLAEYGKVKSSSIRLHDPLEQPADVVVHCSNRTDVTPLPGSDAVAVSVVGVVFRKAPAAGEGPRPARPVVSAAAAAAPLQLDLRGARAEEALEVLDRYLNDVAIAGHDRVRVIHGKGTGALRTAVREVLSRHPLVREHASAGATEGGDGATIVRL